MKIVAAVARVLLGLLFFVFGLNDFLHFIPMGQLPPGPAGQFAALLMSTHYNYAVGFFMVVSAALLLLNRYVPLGLVLLAPVLVNILLFHILMMPRGIGMGAFASVLWILVAIPVRSAFEGLFQRRVHNPD